MDDPTFIDHLHQLVDESIRLRLAQYGIHPPPTEFRRQFPPPSNRPIHIRPLPHHIPLLSRNPFRPTARHIPLLSLNPFRLAASRPIIHHIPLLSSNPFRRVPLQQESPPSAHRISADPCAADRVPSPPLSLSPLVISSASSTLDPEAHLVLKAAVGNGRTAVPIDAMVDSGASCVFISPSLVSSLSLPLIPIPTPRPLSVVDGRPIQSGPITHQVSMRFSVGRHSERLTAYVCSIGAYQIILGISWLRRHSPSIDWPRSSLTFSSHRCAKRCFRSKLTLPTAPPILSAAPPLSISLVSARVWSRLARVAGSSSGVIGGNFTPPLRLASTSSTPDDIAYLNSLCSSIPSAYHDLLTAFSKAGADSLPPHRPYDLTIELDPGTKPPFGPVYSLSEVELAELRRYIEENRARGFIQPSTSPAGSPILFVKKKDGSLRLCVDYRGLNAITRKNRTPLPLINETLDRVREARVFTKLDLRGAYNLIRIAAGDEWKTAFRTRYGLFEYKVVPFGLTNAPAAFQHMMNDGFRDLLDVTVTIYLDDILIYSSDPSKHEQHVREVLERLIKLGLFAKAEKCEFSQTEIDFLGFRISTTGISLAPSELDAIASYPTPATSKDVERFMGFANAYRRFIPTYSRIAIPLYALTKKSIPFKWDETCEEAFKTLKSAFTSSPVLRHFQPDAQTIIETDSSAFAVSAILSQEDTNGDLHPVAYHSRKMTAPECNYGPRDWELLAIVDAVKKWRHYLEGLTTFTVITDHETLKYFTTSRLLTRRQVRWSEAINHYKYAIHYRPGRLNQQCDALSRRPDYFFSTAQLPPVPLLNPISIYAAVLRPTSILAVSTRRSARLSSKSTATNSTHVTTTDLSPNVVTPPVVCTDSRPAIITPSSSKPPVTTSADSNPVITSNPSHIIINPPPAIVTTPSSVTPFPSTATTATTPHSFTTAKVAPPSLPSSSPSLTQRILFHLSTDPSLQPILQHLRNSSTRIPSHLRANLARFSLGPSGLLYHDNKLYIPDSELLKIHILRQAHDHPTAGHFGQAKTIDLLSRTYTWPGMATFARDYVSTCDACQHSKPVHHRYRGLLKPLPIPSRPWGSISWDHITDLPPSSAASFDSILVVVDRLTKLSHFIPCHKYDSAPELARLFVQNIFRLHGIPDDIVSDRGTTFTSVWWSEILRQLRIKGNRSTAFHPQSDGSTERVNQSIEHFLRVFGSYQQDDWADLLPVAEFAFNNSHHSSIGMSPFYATYGFHPRQSLDAAAVPPTVPDAAEYVERLRSLHVAAAAHAADAVARHALYADRHREAFNPADYAPGRLIMLDRRNIDTKRPSRKLDDKRLGPFPIVQAVGPSSFRIKLPRTMSRLHPVFHVSLLEPYRPNKIKSRIIPAAPAPELVDGHEEYDVSDILDCALRNRRLRYLVSWTGYGPEHNSWVPTSAIADDFEPRVAFHRRYPAKPRPP